jgi:hypothetical protein
VPIGKNKFVTKNLENTNIILMPKSQGYLRQDDLIIHYHCLITISEFNNGSFLTVSGDSEIILHVHIRLNTKKIISRLLKIDLNQRQQFFLIDRIAYLYISFYSQTDSA